jgi:hypothetical protein
MQASSLLAAALLGLSALTPTVTFCGDQATGQPSVISVTDDPITAKIRETLNQATSLDFVETPLCEAFQYLEDHHSIPIELDTRALDELGLATDSPLTRNLDGLTLRSALKLLLREFDLTYVIRDQVLLITSVDAAQEMLSTRVYPVADLVKTPSGNVNYGPLIHSITNSITPASWDDAGGPGSIEAYRGSLVISQTEDVHDRIEQFFRQLRAPEVVAAREAMPEKSFTAKERKPADDTGNDKAAKKATEKADSPKRGGGFF